VHKLHLHSTRSKGRSSSKLCVANRHSNMQHAVGATNESSQRDKACSVFCYLLDCSGNRWACQHKQAYADCRKAITATHNPPACRHADAACIAACKEAINLCSVVAHRASSGAAIFDNMPKAVPAAVALAGSSSSITSPAHEHVRGCRQLCALQIIPSNGA
jgi:hypothetical protein